MENFDANEILKIVDGCYYGQAMSFDENQIIKEFIMQQQKEVQELQNRIDEVINECGVNWINKTLKGE